MTTPALAILKKARPDLKLAVVVEPPFVPIFEGNPDIDALLAPTVSQVARWRPRLCLNLHGGTRSLKLTALSGARFRAGFAHFRGALLYNVRIPTAQQILGVRRKVHTAEHLASAVFHLGAGRVEIPPARLFCTETADVPGSSYAVIHAAASAPDKTWPADRFVALARHLETNRKLEPVFIGGAADDLSAFAPFRRVQGAPLAGIKSLMSRASLFVGNDSGPAHMAAAFQVPSVVLFGSSDPEIWAPWKTRSRVLAARDSIRSIALAEALEAIEALEAGA